MCYWNSPGSNNKYVTSGSSQAFSASAKTIMCWWRPEALGSPQYQTLFEWKRSGASTGTIVQTDNTSLTITDVGGGETIATGLSSDTWYCCVMTEDTSPSAGNLYGYNRAVGGTSWSTSGGSTWGNTGNYDTNIGENQVWSSEEFYGEIVAIKQWSTILTTAEFTAESNQILPVKLSNLAVFLPLLNSSDTTTNYQDSGATSFSESGTGSFSDGEMPPIPWVASSTKVIFLPTAAPPTTTHLDLDRGFRRGQPSGLLRGVA